MPRLKRAKQPFQFYTRLHLRQLTGQKASDLKEMLEIIKAVPGSVIYHHTHHFLQQHQYLSPEPPNDFAYWAREVLNEDELAERLSAIDIREFSSIRQLREKIIEVIENHLKRSKRPQVPAPAGEEFYFIKSTSFVLPTPHQAWDLREFMDILRNISINAIYFHIFEARLRLEKGNNDFSLWFKDNLQEGELAQEIANLDPYSHTMEGLRAQIIKLVNKRIKDANPL
jgi:septum formation topological specificity factor MinE